MLLKMWVRNRVRKTCDAGLTVC